MGGTSWLATLPLRARALLLPYGRALAWFVGGYAGATALGQPWALDNWWRVGVPLAAGFGACWYLWRPWALLARNDRGETRRLPLLLVWVLLVAVGWQVRDYLRARLGTVCDLPPAPVAPPRDAVFFRWPAAAYLAHLQLGRSTASWLRRLKGGTQRADATRYYACPLVATAADTAQARTRQRPPLAWLIYTYPTTLGDNLLPGERAWRAANFEARTDAAFDALPITNFSYLERLEDPEPGQYRAVRASRLAPYVGSPLLVVPHYAPFAARGAQALRRGLWGLLGGSLLVVVLLLSLPLRPTPVAPANGARG